MRRATRTERNLLAFNQTAAAYFGFLALDYLVLRLDSVMLGVVRQLQTVPMIVAVAAAFMFASDVAEKKITDNRNIAISL